jgi:hypothetical protein
MPRSELVRKSKRKFISKRKISLKRSNYFISRSRKRDKKKLDRAKSKEKRFFENVVKIILGKLNLPFRRMKKSSLYELCRKS